MTQVFRRNEILVIKHLDKSIEIPLDDAGLVQSALDACLGAMKGQNLTEELLSDGLVVYFMARFGQLPGLRVSDGSAYMGGAAIEVMMLAFHSVFDAAPNKEVEEPDGTDISD